MASSHLPTRLTPALKHRLMQLCREIIQTPSSNGDGTVRLAQWVGSGLRKLGFEVTFQRAVFHDVPQLNLIARKGPKTGRALLFNTHLDTVATEAKAWKKTGGDPFSPVILNGRLYGLGAADTKLALACQWVALESLGDFELKRPLILTGTYGEERGLVGVQQLIRHPWIKPCDVINSEPTELKPVTGNYGFRVYRFEGRGRKIQTGGAWLFEVLFTGKATHSAYPEHGSSAILQALDWIGKQESSVEILSVEGGLAPNIVPPSCTVRLLASSRRLLSPEKWKGRVVSIQKAVDSSFYTGVKPFLLRLAKQFRGKKKLQESFNWGMVRFHEGRLEAFMDHRFAPGKEPKASFKQWQAVAKEANRNGWGNFRLRIEKENPAWLGRNGGPFLKSVQDVLKAIGKPVKPAMKLGCTEAGFFAKKGCRAVIFGPGAAYGNAHQPDECVPVDQLEKAVIFYRELIQRLCR
ncbi:MAG: M20/M25/M40 family metallo-hydrolase [bacterium]